MSLENLMAVDVLPFGAALGADVRGADLSMPISDETLRVIKKAWAAHLVLRFRDQQLTETQLVTFSRRFGPLDKAPAHLPGTREYPNPYVLIVSNIVEDGLYIGSLGAHESNWHMDMSYEAAPPAGSILYAAEIPPAGGDTGFINLYRAYETLPGFLKQAIHRRVCTHDSSHNSVGQQRSGFEPVTDPRQTPGAAHPLVQRHPVTGKTVLYLGRRRNAYIHGLPLDESEDLLDELWSHATAAQNVWYQQWQVGDVLLWDNYATVHRRNGFDPTSRRLLLRTQIASQGPEAA